MKQSEVINDPSGRNPSPPKTDRYFELPSIGLTYTGNSDISKSYMRLGTRSISHVISSKYFNSLIRVFGSSRLNLSFL